MKTIALVLSFTVLALLIESALADGKLPWQTIVAFAEKIFVPEGESDDAWRVVQSYAGGATGLAGGLPLTSEKAPPSLRTAGGVTSAVGVASLFAGLYGQAPGRKTAEKALITSSALYREIEGKIGKEKADELAADLRAHTGLLRLVRDYGDTEQSASFLMAFRAERERLAGLIPDSVMERGQRNTLLDLGAARRAALTMAMLNSSEVQKKEIQKLLGDNLRLISGITAGQAPPPARPVVPAAGTH